MWGHYLCNTVIKHDYLGAWDSIEKVMKRLEPKGLIEKFKHCPNLKCNRDFSYSSYMPLKCDTCHEEWFPETITFKNRHEYPRFFIKIPEKWKNILFKFINLHVIFNKFIGIKMRKV